MASGAELIRKIKEQIEEVDPKDVHELRQNGNGAVIVDVREQHEFEEAHLPGAVHVPRGHLESRIEGAVADRSKRVILYCASGQPLRARRPHAAGAARLRGRRLDARRHHALEGPRLRRRGPARADRRAARALLAPPAHPGDRPRGPAEAARREGAPARRRRARLAGRALPGRRRRRHARHRRQRRGRPLEPPAPGRALERAHRRAQGRLRRDRDPRDQPGREGREVPDPARRRQHHGDHRRLRRDRRRPRQLPHALPPERRERAPADPGRVGVDPRLRGPAVGLPPVRGPVLPLPLPDAAAGRAGAVVRRRRRARRAARA